MLQILLVVGLVIVMSVIIHLICMHNCDNARTLVSLAFAVYVIGYLYFTIFSETIPRIV